MKYISILMLSSFLLLFNLFGIEPPKKLFIKDIIIGNSNEIVSDNDKISVHYKGWIFNSNLKENSPCDAKGEKFDDSNDKVLRAKYGIGTGEFSFQLGQRLVIPGWELGFKGMKVGGIRCLVIPPKLGYGARKVGDVIPPNSTLIFEIELVSINTEEN